jgi:hypothetical protein
MAYVHRRIVVVATGPPTQPKGRLGIVVAGVVILAGAVLALACL